MSSKQTPVEETVYLVAKTTGHHDARRMVAELIDYLADVLNNHPGLRSYTDDHMSDINEATEVLRDIAEGIRR